MRKLLYLFLICVVAAGIVGVGGYFIIQYKKEKEKIEVMVFSSPPEATIYINKKKYPQKTPATIVELEPGWHEFKVAKKGYLPWSSTLQLFPSEKKEISVKLIPIPPPQPPPQPTPTPPIKEEPKIIFSKLHINSSPSGASIYIAGKLMGKTPSKFEFESGKSYSILIKKQFYQDYRKSIYLPKRGYVLNAPLRLIPGKITIESIPEVASLYINGKYRGETPITVSVEPWKAQKIELKKEGYLSWSEDIFTDPGEEVKLEAKLREEKKGYLYITSSPPGADIFVGDKYIGKTPLRRVPALTGRYSFSAKLEGFKIKEKVVEVEEERPAFLHFSLEPIGTPTE